ncbi:MAG: acetyl-CoA decarbonylase/synthase complex subunit delta [Candidatus Heimdallarchaeota archaeon]|nr:acetyl-CoA decarbonylase/synthase complex subunit delta [Candidatus Heimdallarchaeota archaeon]
MNFEGKITEVILGSKEQAITIGGQASLPFIGPRKIPAIGLVLSDEGVQLPRGVPNPYPKVCINDLISWAKYCEKNYPVNALMVKFSNETKAPQLLEELINAISVPLIISGSGEREKDKEIIKKCGEIAEGENLLLCSVELEDYKSIAATALAYDHTVVAESPIDINIAKQLNILLTDFGLPLERIVIDPLVAALGYGLEYTFSVMERIRAQAFNGDKLLASPIVCFAFNGWRAREASFEYEEWGALAERGILWEAMTASSLYSVGADLIVFQHPQSITLFRQLLEVQ